MSSRTQKIGIGNNISNHEPVKQGVSQGSILGTLLFILFINDLPLENIKCNIDRYLYADDTTLHCHSNRKSEIERSLNTVNIWCIQNNMLINPTKTTCMFIGTAQRIATCTVTNELNINLENQFIKNVNTKKLLGIYIDNNLDWKEQVDHICKNINSRLFLLSKIKIYLDKKSRILFFNSYILPIFDYCSNVWGNLNDEGIQRITKLQKRAARIILDAPFLTPTRELFENLNWLSFCDRISYNKLVLVHKILHDKTPNYLKKLCIPSSKVHTRNLRSVSSNNLAVIRPNTNIMKKLFAYSSAILGNKLPCNIKLSASLSIFKSKCFTYLKDISN